MQRSHKKALELILRNNCLGMAELREDGVWPSERAIESDPSQELLWRPVCDLDGPNAPDPLETPCLPIQFTASELAAFMLGGIGAYFPSIYGDFQNGPDEGMLASFGPLGIKAKEALITAYAAYRQAQSSVGAFDRAPEIQAEELADMYKKKHHEANIRQRVFESDISAEEARERRERASASVAPLLVQFDEAKRVADCTFTVWRKAMVHQLLQSQYAPEAAFEDEKQSIERIRCGVLASRTQLIEAFSFYGVELKIFKALKDRPGLMAARRVKGKGQKGSLAEPMFCPFKVINWLVKTGVKEKPRLNDFTGWHILETKFPAVYAEKSIGDLRQN